LSDAFRRFDTLEKGEKMSHDLPAFTQNNLLNALPIGDLERIRPLLQKVDLPSGKVLYEPDEKISHVYFPDRAMISVVAYTESGQAAEVAVIGNEGATGLDVVMGSDTAPNQFITQLPNGALRMRTADIREEFHRCGAMHDLLLAFTRNLIVQLSQTAICNRLHSMEQRLSRWLLMCRDRTASEVLPLTQEFLAIMLGSTRTSVTLTAIEIQNHGFIAYKRGKITIVDREGLKSFS